MKYQFLYTYKDAVSAQKELAKFLKKSNQYHFNC